MHTSCTSLLRAAGSRVRPHHSLITVELAASGAGSPAPPAAAFRICAAAVLVLCRVVLSRCHVSRLGDLPPHALPLKDDLGLGSMSGAQAEGRAGALPPSPVSIPGPPPPQCLRQVPSRPWAILLHPGRRGTHHPCAVVVRTRDPLDRSVPAEDGREVNVPGR